MTCIFACFKSVEAVVTLRCVCRAWREAARQTKARWALLEALPRQPVSARATRAVEVRDGDRIYRVCTDTKCLQCVKAADEELMMSSAPRYGGDDGVCGIALLDKHVYVAIYSRYWDDSITMLDKETLKFQCTFGRKLLRWGAKEVVYDYSSLAAGKGMLIAANRGHHCIKMFSAEGLPLFALSLPPMVCSMSGIAVLNEHLVLIGAVPLGRYQQQCAALVFGDYADKTCAPTQMLMTKGPASRPSLTGMENGITLAWSSRDCHFTQVLRVRS